MDRVSRCSRGEEGIVWGSLRVSSPLFAVDLVHLAPSHDLLKHALERFAAEFEAVGMWNSTSKSESMVLSRNGMISCFMIG